MSLKTSVDTSDNKFNVVQIHDVKKEKGKNLYLVEWEGYPSKEEYTWEPHKNLKDCFIFHKYLSEKRGKKRKREDRGILVKDIFKKTKRDSLSKDERFDLIRSQNYKCNLCLNPFGSSSFEIDHIIPLEQGGTNDLANLQGLCDSCHIFKTTVLDRGVIARLLQAKLQDKSKSLNLSRTQILEECQMVYFNRNRNRIPFHEEEMLNFCITTVDIYREMCKKEVKKRVNDIMKITNMEDSKIELKINDEADKKQSQPPAPPNDLNDKIQDNTRKSTYLNNLLSIINKLILLKIKSNVLYMKYFTLTVTINFEESVKTDDEIYDDLNDFFKDIHLNKPDESEKIIGCVTISYKIS